MNVFEMVVAIVVVSTGSGVLTAWIKHRSHVVELKLQARSGQVDTGVRAEIEALRQEVRQLRETTMQYDLSFDTALQNMERRVTAMERRPAQTDANLPNELRSRG